MNTVMRDSWSLLLCTAVIMSANVLMTTLLGLRGAIENFSTFSLGLVMSGYFMGFLASSVLTPRLLRWVGHVRVYAAYASGASACLILYVTVLDPTFWAVVRFATGFCMAGIYVVSESWLNGINANTNRGRALSLYVAAQLIGSVFGQVLVAAGDPSGYGLFILSTVLMSLAIGPMLLTVSPVPVFETAQPMSLRELHRASPLAVSGMVLVGITLSMVYSMMAVCAAELGFNAREVATMVGVLYLGGSISLYPAGWLSDRIGRRPVIVGLSAIMVLAGIVAALIGANPLALLVAVGVIGAVAAPTYSVLIAHANDTVERDRMAACGALMIFLHGIGAMAGPPLAGAAMTLYGPLSYFLLLALGAGLLGLYALYRMARRTSPETEMEMGFALMPQKGSAVGAAMYASALQASTPERE